MSDREKELACEICGYYCNDKCSLTQRICELEIALAMVQELPEEWRDRFLSSDDRFTGAEYCADRLETILQELEK